MATHQAGKTVFAISMPEKDGKFKTSSVERRELGPKDVSIDIKYAGICHSDVSQVKGEWGESIFPMVPGHEIAGLVREVGSEVTKFKEGERVGVGCMVDSCQSCKNCCHGEEQFCKEGSILTYNDKYRIDRDDGDYEKPTYGGYSSAILVREDFVLRLPENLEFSASAPLLCAGITTYSPLIHFGLRPNHRMAVAGLGGLGHMAVKIGKAFGAHVTVLSRGTKKRDSALKLGADEFVDSTDDEQMNKVEGTFDMIVNTIGVKHDPNPYINCLTLDGTMAIVGVSPEIDIQTYGLLSQRRRITGSLIGGIAETQECLDFCGRNNITCEVEMVEPKAEAVDKAYERMLESDVKYRFVIDMTKAPQEPEEKSD